MYMHMCVQLALFDLHVHMSHRTHQVCRRLLDIQREEINKVKQLTQPKVPSPQPPSPPAVARLRLPWPAPGYCVGCPSWATVCA